MSMDSLKQNVATDAGWYERMLKAIGEPLTRMTEEQRFAKGIPTDCDDRGHATVSPGPIIVRREHITVDVR